MKSERADRTWQRMSVFFCFTFLGVFFAQPTRSDATIVDATSFGGQEIISYNSVTNTQSVLVNTPSRPDSLIFDQQGNIIYTLFNAGQLWEYNPITKTDSLITRIPTSTLSDIALSPGGNHVFVTSWSSDAIYKVNLGNGSYNVFSSSLFRPSGIVFTPNGNLYVNSFGGAIFQLNPATGATIHSASVGSLDGLTYNSANGLLYAGGSSSIFAINPTTLAYNSINTGFTTDGLEATSNGNVYLADTSTSTLYEYSTSTTALTPLTNISGLDDMAPLSGLGALPPTLSGTPEPSTIALFGTGILLMGFMKIRNRKGLLTKA